MKRRADKIIGCIIGGAIGDSLGGPYEGSRNPVDVNYNHKWRLSDDTLLTLATCESISEKGRVDPASIANTFTAWFKQSRLTGLGASTYKALSELSHGGHWALVGRKGEMAAGNGAAMRIAPLAFCLDPKDSKARVLIRDVCRITHHNEEAYAGALAVALAIRAAWDGTWEGGSDLTAFVAGHLPDTSVRERLAELAGATESRSLGEIALKFGCSGYVVETVPLALMGVQRILSVGFQCMLEELVSCGGDTDTIASIAGQIAGTLVGQTGVPEKMVKRLPELNTIMVTAEMFSAAVAKATGQ